VGVGWCAGWNATTANKIEAAELGKSILSQIALITRSACLRGSYLHPFGAYGGIWGICGGGYVGCVAAVSY
jgi:hypothetical protein